MAEVEKVVPTAATTSSATAADNIPVSAGSDTASGTIELGTSPTQERSSNSHPHDSEYDTASDLEGGDDYDDDDDELDDESMTDGESMTDEDDEEDEENERGVSQEKTDAEAQKKVDEDRSNPQYIPKRGTFYEHDDRTAEGEIDGPVVVGDGTESIDGGSGAKSPQSPTISQASRTMKKWQPASGVERWSHDRFDASEQAPKSRTELVSAYGYDIRNEDNPPRARRRRRYGRGPSKYSRNWEDENAYLKASNKDRKPPRPSDFPALNERGTKLRKTRGTREEKENRVERRQAAGLGSASEKSTEQLPRANQYGDERKKGGNKKTYGRPGNAPVGRQAAMEFKQKQQRSGQTNQAGGSNNNRNDFERHSNRPQNATSNNEPMMNEPQKMGNKTHQNHGKQHQQQQQMHPNNAYNNSTGGKNHDLGYQQQQLQPSQQQQQQQAMSMRQQMPAKTVPASSLSQRLQQVQNRNDPSHVGSVQMHALATQSQMVGPQQQQQQQPGAMLLTQQQQMEQRGPPKRYSSLRRSQHEAQHIAEQHQLQQLHLQQQQQQQPLLLQDQQHLLQANLMQLYHQENLQAQMQALQVSQPPSIAPSSIYGGATASNATTSLAPAAYTFGGAAAANAQPPPPNYLPPAAQSATAATTLAYSGAPPPQPQQSVPVAAPAYGPASAVSPPAAPAAYGPATVSPPTAAAANSQAPTSANPNYPNYQNYNTVGGTTYFVPPAQATTRPVVLPQRRPTNAIPILPPSEKNKQRTPDGKDDAKNQPLSTAPIGSAENIDHIIDNMFVQRPVFQPPPQSSTAASSTRKSSSPPSAASADNNTSSSGASDSNASPGAPADDVVSTTSANSVSPSAAVDKASNKVDGAPIENSNNSAAVVQE